MTAVPTSLTPRDGDLGLSRVPVRRVLPSPYSRTCVFVVEQEQQGQRIMLNQVLGSSVGGGIVQLCLRIGGSQPSIRDGRQRKREITLRFR